MDLSDPERSIVRPIHQSVLFRPYCIQILTPSLLKYVSCYTEEEYKQWLNRLGYFLFPTFRFQNAVLLVNFEKAQFTRALSFYCCCKLRLKLDLGYSAISYIIYSMRCSFVFKRNNKKSINFIKSLNTIHVPLILTYK